MKRVFVDTGAFFALVSVEDAVHDRALEIFDQARREKWQLVTTNAVLYETHALLLTRTREGRPLALRFLESMTTSGTKVERIRKVDEEHALALLRSHRDKNYSFCDALSFAVMHRLRVTTAIAFDRHFRKYGRFTVL